MTDRELLELAAKANGTNGVYLNNAPINGEYKTGLYDGLTERCWNPLTDDGDAMRLSSDLELNVYHVEGSVFAEALDAGVEIRQDHGSDKHAATRRAILLAAAEIGKDMP